MATCSNCFKQNPPDAVFCGFCGGKISEKKEEAAEAGAKTMFGYNLDAGKMAGAQPRATGPKPEVAPAPVAPPPAAAVPPPSGEGVLAGKYRLGGPSTRLAAGELFPAQDSNQNENFEILLVDKTVFQSPLDMERARRELRQLQKVESPAIVRVVDHGKAEDDRLYVVMEKAVGRPLDELMAGSALPLAVAQRVVRGVGTGLAEAQKMGVIHRDIAPHNIIVAPSGDVKVRGFGIAAPIKRHVYGTPAFISPEQAAGRPVDQRSNIYSLGALMFYMLTGEPPFDGANVDELLQKHQKQEPESPNKRCPGLNLPPRAEALVLKALAKSSSRRHLTLRQFLREVDALAAIASPQDQAKDSGPRSFETPLHGMTALQAGKRPPPSSELSPVKPASPAIADNSQPVSDVMANKAMPPPDRVGAMAPTLMEVPTGQTAQPGAPSPASPHRRSQITGEVSSNVELRKPDPSLQPPPAQTAPKQAGTAPKQAGAAPKPAKGKAAFRETMWFYKGEVESAMADEGSEEAAKPEGESSPEELAAKYSDDGSLSDDAVGRLSLRTGKTQMMQQANVPRGQLPGARMEDRELLGEISSIPRVVIWIGGAVVLAGIGGLLAYLFLA